MTTQNRHLVSLPSFSELLLSISSLRVARFSLPVEPSSGASHYRKIARGRRKKGRNVLAHGERYRDATTISMLPDDVLLEIFAFCPEANMWYSSTWRAWTWHLLVHVCQKWRQIVFASPHRLNLRILCHDGTPVRENLGIWPPFPLVIEYGHDDDESGITAPDGVNNLIAALEHPDRVDYLVLNVTGSQLEKIATVMQEPFPALTRLDITLLGRNALALPDKFLGGSAPILRDIYLWGIPSPALPTLLLSANDLISLFLWDIPPTGYISPQAMVLAFAVLPRLKYLVIKFQSATPRPNRIRPPPVTLTVLPALKTFMFQGASEYLEDLVTQIDSPQLDKINITYLNQLIDFQVARLSNFIDRSVGHDLILFNYAVVGFWDSQVAFCVGDYTYHPCKYRSGGMTTIKCKGIDWQVSHMAQVLGAFSATLSVVNHLELHASPEDPSLEGIANVEWPDLLHKFSAVKTLQVSQQLAGHVALALENIPGGMFAEASLDLIYLEGQPASSIEKFVANRQLSGRPVTVIDTEAEFKERRLSYIREGREDVDVPDWMR